jgi:hypothetical protein
VKADDEAAVERILATAPTATVDDPATLTRVAVILEGASEDRSESSDAPRARERAS